MKIIEDMRRFQAATLGRVQAAMPPKSTKTPITIETIRQQLEAPLCSPTTH